MQFSFVAFLDILGFSQLVEKDSRQPNPGSLYLDKMRDALNGIPAPTQEYGLIQFSDSIIVSCPFSNNYKEVNEFLNFVGAIQSGFLEKEILLRGGIAIGQHFQDEKILYSQGLVEAYRLESEQALGPRILVSTDLIDLVDPSNQSNFPILIDEDSQCFLDYLRDCDLEPISALIERTLNDKSMSERARQKWIWLGRYYEFKSNTAINGLPQIRCR